MGYEIIKTDSVLAKPRGVRYPPFNELYPIDDLEVGYCLQIDHSDFPGMDKKQIMLKVSYAIQKMKKISSKRYSVRTGIKHINIFRIT